MLKIPCNGLSLFDMNTGGRRNEKCRCRIRKYSKPAEVSQTQLRVVMNKLNSYESSYELRSQLNSYESSYETCPFFSH